MMCQPFSVQDFVLSLDGNVWSPEQGSQCFSRISARNVLGAPVMVRSNRLMLRSNVPDGRCSIRPEDSPRLVQRIVGHHFASTVSARTA